MCQLPSECRSDASFPPNFLYGDKEKVKQNLVQCAPRIWYRLKMWRVPEQRWRKSPMLPITALGRLDMSTNEWRASDELMRLETYAENLLAASNTRSEDLMHRRYEALSECLVDCD